MPIARLNDTELFYLQHGEGQPCLVMHGGLGFDHTHVRPWIDHLGDTFQLIFYDHRGNGRSGRPLLETLTYEQFAADADALRAYFEFEKIAVMGFSAGGAIALHYALNFPERVSHLILVGSHAAWDYGDEIAENLQQICTTAEIKSVLDLPPPRTNDDFRELIGTLMPLYYHRFDPEANRLFIRDVVWCSTAYLRYEELLATHDVTSRLGEIRVPALVIVGRHDFITPVSQAERLQQQLADAQLVIFEESGHMPYIEEPERFRDTVRCWLTSL